MNKDYYKEYYEHERKHWWFRARKEILEAMVQQVLLGRPSANILNVGIATGASSQMLAKYGQVTSVEYDADCCAFVREALGLEVVQASVTQLPFSRDHFDLVCAFDVIEHVEDDAAGVAEMIRTCRPGGTVLVTVPALQVLWSEHDEINQHCRRYSKGELMRLFADPRKGVIEFCSYFNTLLFLPIFSVRMLSKIFSGKRTADKSRSDFSRYKAGMLSGWLYKVFVAEKLALTRSQALPVGVSLLLKYRKR